MKLARLIATAVLALGLLWAAAAQAGDISLSVQPEMIDIDTLYNGTSVSLNGTIPSGSQVLIRLVGAPTELRMKEKGKALGLLWMNQGSLTFKNVPQVCLVQSSVPLDTLDSAAGPLRLSGVTGSMEVESATADKAAVLSELIKLKQSEGLYMESVGGIEIGAPSGGQDDTVPFKATVQVPSRLSPGKYSVEVYAIRDGQVAGQGTRTVQAKLVSAPAFLADMAFGHGAFYGILATVIAIVSGLLVGLVFQSKGAH